jgi:cytidine deaminase
MEIWKTMLTDDLKRKLINSALQTRQRAYAPYSGYAVGAALLTRTGEIYTGVNVENAAYPTSICAERVAVFKAVSEGEREYEAMVVASSNGGSPCGACRQVLSEFGLGTKILIVDGEGRVVQETTVGDLLPGAFTAQDLPHQEK